MNSEGLFFQLYPVINENDDEDCPEIDSYTITIKGKESNDIINFKEPKMTEFLSVITKTSTGMSKEYLSIITKFIRNTKLIQKVETDHYKMEKRVSVSSLCDLCANLLQFQELKKGDILFRIHDIGDRCFFLIRGKLSVLKLKDINGIKMTPEEYLNYLLFLKEKEEVYIVKEVIQKNYQQFSIDRIDNLTQLSRLLFRMIIRSSIDQKSFALEDLMFLFKKYNKTFEEFDIDTETIKTIWDNKTQNYINADIEWRHYLNRKFNLKSSEIILFNQYNFLLSEIKKEWTFIVYERFLYLGNGAFFGDTALDTVEKRRNATIRAETDTIVASLSDADYLKLIAPKNKKEKANLVSYLNNNFFFKTISSYSFEKLYFHHFAPHEYLQHHMLYNCGAIPKDLIFLKEGKVAINIKCSVIDLYYYIKYLIDQISNLPCFTKEIITHHPILSKETILDLNKLITDQTLNKLQSQSETFIKSMNKIQIFQLFILSGKDLVGIEEIILNRPFITIAKVLTVKASFFTLDVSKLNKILDEEKSVRYVYTKFAANKIISLIERLNHIKKNCIDLTLSKVKYKELRTLSPINEEKKNLKDLEKLGTNLIYNIIKLDKGNLKQQKNIIHFINLNKKNRSISLELLSNKNGKKNDKNNNNTNNQWNNNTHVYIGLNQQNNAISEDKVTSNNAKNNDKTYVDVKIQKELDEFSSINNESQKKIEVKSQQIKCNIINSTPNNWYKSNSLNKQQANEEIYQSVTINELYNSQFNNNKLYYNHVKKMEVMFKKMKKNRLLKIVRNKSQQDIKINKSLLNLQDDLISKFQPDPMSLIVKEYHQKRRKCGYSLIVNNPNNYYLNINQKGRKNNNTKKTQKINKSYCDISN